MFGLVLNISGLVFGYWTLTTGQKLIQSAQDATRAEVLEIKKALGLSNGGVGKFVTRERLETVEQFAHETRERLRALEIKEGA